MKTEFNGVIPVLPSADISRHVAWYKDRTGFEVIFSDNMYAVLNRDNLICIYSGIRIQPPIPYQAVG